MGDLLSIEMKQSQMRIVHVQQRGKHVKIKSCFRCIIPDGLVEDGFILNVDALVEVLQEELKKRKLDTIKKISFTVYSTRIVAKEIVLPIVKKKDILKMIQMNSYEYFPVDISDYVLSYDILEKVDNKQYKMMVYATPKELGDSYLQLVKQGGFQFVRLDYSNHSMYKILQKKYATGSHMILKLEEAETIVTIIKNGTLALQRSLTFSGNNPLETMLEYPIFGANDDYKKGWELLKSQVCMYPTLEQEELERYKEEDGEELWIAKCEVTESLRQVMDSVIRIMDYYLAKNAGEKFDSISYVGIACEVLGVQELFQTEFGQEVNPIQEIEGIPYKREYSEQKDSLGVFLGNIGSICSELDLLQYNSIEKKKKKRTSPSWIIFTTGTTLALILSIGSVVLYQKELQENKRLEQEIDKRKEIETIYRTYETAKEEMAQLKEIYEKTEHPNDRLVAFIEELEEKMPASLRITSFSSNGSEMSFHAIVSTKEESAELLMQLRTFESLSDVETTQVTQNDSQEYELTVTGTYQEQAVLEQEEANQ